MLLDQKRIAGVGNIYADEALFRARVHPLRRADTLNRRQCEALRDAVVASLQAGIEAKGATIDDFRDPDGVSGSFQDRFLIHLREGEPCLRCGRAVRKLRAARARDLRLREVPAQARVTRRRRGPRGRPRGRPARAPDSRRAGCRR